MDKVHFFIYKKEVGPLLSRLSRNSQTLNGVRRKSSHILPPLPRRKGSKSRNSSTPHCEICPYQDVRKKTRTSPTNTVHGLFISFHGYLTNLLAIGTGGEGQTVRQTWSLNKVLFSTSYRTPKIT